MTVVAVTMVRDEADIIASTVGHMLREVDYVIVADNLSTDATRDELARVSTSQLIVVDDLDPAYRQSAKMTALAQRARTDLGATWVVPFDADEWWTAGDRTIAEVLEDAGEWHTVAATLFDHVATGHDDATIDQPIARLGWRRTAPVPLPKVAARALPDLVIEQGNHSATYLGRRAATRGGLLTVHHYPYRSAEQFVRKVRNGAAAYAAASDVRPDFGAHWRQWGKILERDGEAAVIDIFRTWYYRDDPTAPIRIGDEWQEALLWDPA